MSGAVALAPFLPMPVILGFLILCTILCVVMGVRAAPGAIWRFFASLAITVMVLNPRIVDENRAPQTDVVALIVDRTASQNVGRRGAQTDDAVRHLKRRIEALKNVEIEEVIVKDAVAGSGRDEGEGSLALGALRRALGGIPKKRVAGAVVISDGQIHDHALIDDMRDIGAPVHLLLTGEPAEIDRRLVIEKTPAYGLVGKDATISYRVEDRVGRADGALDQLARVTLKEGDKVIAVAQVPVGRTGSFTVPLTHAGPTVLTLQVEATPGELSRINNRALVTINGVRERLRVLLVSGQPHAGERVWRNLLKSDPAVDLVHFTILRPPEKDDFTPLNEISLIAFPTRELFEVKIKEFDLVVFDRYVVRDVLPPSYLRNIIGYVREGGALLLAVGPEFATPRSLFNTALGEVIPAAPTGRVIEQAYRPSVTEIGERHPVSANLPKARASRANRGTGDWGRWFRHVETAARAGHTLMAGPGKQPLLVLDRIGDGRVAAMLSDHIWLWARGFEGGGPHAELMRRLAHWLMKEPDLEEEGLRARVRDGKLHIIRRSLREASAQITVTTPAGIKQIHHVKTEASGLAELVLPASETGLYRISDGERQALAAVGSLNPLEFSDLRATSAVLKPLVEASEGGVIWIRDGLPDLRKVRHDRDRAGRGWLGLVGNRSYVVTGVTEFPLVPPIVLMIGLLALLMGAWWREGR